MKLDGLDYNTQRDKLVLPEYGRIIQDMVEYALTLQDRKERQKCAESIIAIMGRMYPEGQGTEDHERKLWDHLALMSGFKLDIDYPYDITEVQKLASKPEPMAYPMKKIPVRHYGNMMFEIFDKLKTMEPGEERDELVRIVANQMKRNLIQWSHGSSDNEKVAADLARFTDGKIQLDLDQFEFDKTSPKEPEAETGNRKRRR